MDKILIVDDSPTIRRMIRASLRDVDDIVIDEAGNGLEAIERLALGPVSVMLLDLNMPDMHGMDVLQFLRRHEAYKSIPVVVLTTKSDPESRSAAMEAGTSLYLTKPFDPAALSSHVRRLLGRR